MGKAKRSEEPNGCFPILMMIVAAFIVGNILKGLGCSSSSREQGIYIGSTGTNEGVSQEVAADSIKRHLCSVLKLAPDALAHVPNEGSLYQPFQATFRRSGQTGWWTVHGYIKTKNDLGGKVTTHFEGEVDSSGRVLLFRILDDDDLKSD